MSRQIGTRTQLDATVFSLHISVMHFKARQMGECEGRPDWQQITNAVASYTLAASPKAILCTASARYVWKI